jgi:membrane protease subunit HflC
MNKTLGFWLMLIAAIFALLIVSGAFYVVSETEQVIVTQFGQPIGAAISQAGVHFKVPFTQQVNRIEERVLEWDGPSAVMTTKDKLFIIVDAFGRWQIKDPLQFFLRLRDERSALSRLDDILGSEMRNTIARHELVELVRTTKGRRPAQDAALVPTIPGALATPIAPTDLPPIQFGRVALEDEIARQARAKLLEFGIELLDIRFKRINYNPEVSAKIFERMISERRQIADRFRSEGAGEAARILGKKERDLNEISSEAYRKVEGIKGKADAEATAIYAAAYNQTADAREFYEFQRALETYRTAFSRDTTVVLTTDGGFLRFLKGDMPTRSPAKTPAPPGGVPQPAAAP